MIAQSVPKGRRAASGYRNSGPHFCPLPLTNVCPLGRGMPSSQHAFRVQTMTPEERARPELLAQSASRRRRIARDSDRGDSQVNELLKSFTEMRIKMKSMSKMMIQAGGMGVFRTVVLLPALGIGV